MAKNESSDEKEDELENAVFEMKCYIVDYTNDFTTHAQ